MKSPSQSFSRSSLVLVERTLQDMPDSLITLPALKRTIGKHITTTELSLILEYLEEINKIASCSKGICWIYTQNATLRTLIASGTEV